MVLVIAFSNALLSDVSILQIISYKPKTNVQKTMQEQIIFANVHNEFLKNP
jgi:hypothetical protein